MYGFTPLDEVAEEDDDDDGVAEGEKKPTDGAAEKEKVEVVAAAAGEANKGAGCGVALETDPADETGMLKVVLLPQVTILRYKQIEQR